MEVTINIDGQPLSVKVTAEVYEYLDRAGHKEELWSPQNSRMSAQGGRKNSRQNGGELYEGIGD